MLPAFFGALTSIVSPTPSPIGDSCPLQAVRVEHSYASFAPFCAQLACIIATYCGAFLTIHGYFSGRLLLLQRRHQTDMITYSRVDTQTIRTFFHMRNLTHTSFPDLVAARGFAAMRGPVNTFILPGPVALPYLVARSSLSALSPHNPHSIPCPDNARIPNGAYPQCTHSTCRKCGLGERLTV